MASLPYPCTLLQQCSPTDFTDLHRWLGCVVGSHRFHRIHRSLLLRRNSHRFVGGYGILAIPMHPATAMFSHRFHGFTQMVRLRSGLPQISQNTQKFIAEKELPQRTLRGCTCLKCTNLLTTYYWLVHLRQVHPLEGGSLLLRRNSHRFHGFTQM